MIGPPPGVRVWLACGRTDLRKGMVTDSGRVSLTPAQLSMLLEGIDWVRRETDARQRVKVPYDEGVASHIGPESCAGGREAVRRSVDRGTRRPAIERRKTSHPERRCHPVGRRQHGPVALSRAPVGSASSVEPGMRVRLATGTERSPVRPRQPGGGPHGEGGEPKTMMHGPEKSDSPIVPMKPANKAGRSAAESVEGRGGAKGNAGLQSTVRTQSREAVSQAQNRIREAVNRNSKEKLTALLHHVTIDVLRAAFFALKRRAAPGIDEVTWDTYEETLRG